MVSLEDLFYTLIADVHNGRDMDSFNVPGEYLNASMPKEKRILMKLRGDFVATMCQVNPEYELHGRYKNGETFCVY